LNLSLGWSIRAPGFPRAAHGSLREVLRAIVFWAAFLEGCSRLPACSSCPLTFLPSHYGKDEFPGSGRPSFAFPLRRSLLFSGSSPSITAAPFPPPPLVSPEEIQLAVNSFSFLALRHPMRSRPQFDFTSGSLEGELLPVQIARLVCEDAPPRPVIFSFISLDPSDSSSDAYPKGPTTWRLSLP